MANEIFAAAAADVLILTVLFTGSKCNFKDY